MGKYKIDLNKPPLPDSQQTITEFVSNAKHWARQGVQE